MTPEEEQKKEDREMVERVVRRAAIFSEGVRTPFWDELLLMFKEERERALDDFADTPYSETAAIIEQQVIAKIGRYLKQRVEAAIIEADNLIQ